MHLHSNFRATSEHKMKAFAGSLLMKQKHLWELIMNGDSVFDSYHKTGVIGLLASLTSMCSLLDIVVKEQLWLSC